MDSQSDVFKHQQIRPQHPFSFHSQNTISPHPECSRNPSEFRNPPTGSSGSITDHLKELRAASSMTQNPDGYSKYYNEHNSPMSGSAIGNLTQKQQPGTWQDTGGAFISSSQTYQGPNHSSAQWSSSVPFPAPVFCPSVPPPGLPPFTRPPPFARDCGRAVTPVGQIPPPFHPHNFGSGLPQNSFRGEPPQPQNSFRGEPPQNFGSIPPQNSFGTFPLHSNLKNSAPCEIRNVPSGSGISPSSQLSSVPRFAFPQGSGAQLPACQTESVASESGKEDSQVCDTEAQLEVNSWLKSIGKWKKVDLETSSSAGSDEAKNIQQSLSFGEAQNKLRNVLHALAAVQGELQQLEEEHIMADADKWKACVMKIKQLKETYIQAKQEVDVKQLDYLKKKFELCKKKRERQQRHKQQRKVAKHQALFERAQKHAAIGQWRNNILQQYIHQQQVKQMKETADKTLNKVRREIREARKILETVSGLEKLRAVRCDTAEKRGQTFPPSVVEHFKYKTHDLTQLLVQQIEAYEKEEVALKLILETEKEEAEERKKVEKQKKKKELQQTELEEEKLCLFGPSTIPASGDQMHSFVSYYQQAVYNFQSLQNIREEWDRFLVPDNTPMASRIPDGWVCPEPPQSSVWASVLHQQTT